MIKRVKKSLIFFLFCSSLISFANDQKDSERKSRLESILSGFDKRVDALFRSESGRKLKRAKKEPPLKPGRGNYTRAYSYSIVQFAARCFYLKEKTEEANAALVENAQHYLDNPKDIHDRDSFHWHAEIVMRLIEEYGTHGTKSKGLLTKETEEIALKPIWEYVKKASTLQKSEFQKSKTWDIYESENHHAMIFTTCWHFSKLAKDLPQFKNQKYDDGNNASVHYEAWNKYFLVYCRERASKGMFIEMMNDGYNSTLIKGIYNFYDFGNSSVKKAAGQLLDLYLAYWAQEQINIVIGGGKSREYFYKSMKQSRNHSMATQAWLYFGMGKISKIYGHDLAAALSTYRPPLVVADIAMDHQGRGVYEVKQRPMGLTVNESMHPYKMNLEKGGIIRYSYCTPSFILGTTMNDARSEKDWSKISSQNRWQGVVFDDSQDARIIPIVRPKDNRVAFNAHWSVQSKGTLITQKLKSNKGGAEMLVWMSKAGLSEPQTEDGIVFVEAKNAYAAIRVIRKGFRFVENFDSLPGGQLNKRGMPPANIMILKDQFSPLILEVATKQKIKTFNEFKAKVKNCKLSIQKNYIEYQSVYGDNLKFFFDYSQLPSVNGGTINPDKGMAFDGPFLKGEWNTGVVTIQKGPFKKILNFK